MTRIDSRGLESLTSLHRQCDEELGLMRICGVDETTRKIMEMTRLDQEFVLYRNVEEATASLT
jgi:anti-anti-sigma factor